MFPALLTVLLFAASAVAGERTARYWGSERGNLIRLAIATTLMWAVTLAFFPQTVRPVSYGWLFLSGVVGFGLGDICLFLAYVRVGARLAILLNLCTAPLWGAGAEWLWLGTALGGGELAAGAVILVGVALAILSRDRSAVPRAGSRWAGVLFALGAGCGQGMGAVISRKAIEAAARFGTDLNGFSAAAQRVSGGFAATLAVVLVMKALGERPSLPAASTTRGKAVGWLLATTFCGPILGVSAFQWALSVLPAGIVTAVTATTPIAMIPLVMATDREKPRPLSLAGAALAVGGVLLLLRLRGQW